MTDYTKVTGVAAADIVKIDGVAIADIEKVDGATKPSGAAIDWTDSLWDETNLQDCLGDWSGGSGTDGAEPAKRDFGPDGSDNAPRANMDHTVVPFIDSSGETNYLKFMCPLRMGLQTIYRFLEVDEGTRVEVNGGTNPDSAAKSDTGVEIDSATGNLVDIQIVVKVGYKRVPAKGSTLYRRQTAVIDVSSNVMKAFTRITNNTFSSVAYYTAAETVSWGACDWAFEYDPATNEWTNEGSGVNPGYWQHAINVNVATGPDSTDNGCEKTISSYYVDDDTDEHRIWFFKTG